MRAAEADDMAVAKAEVLDGVQDEPSVQLVPFTVIEELAKAAFGTV